MGVHFRIRDYGYPLAVLAQRRLMREAPFWAPWRLDDWARERRRQVVRHAAQHVPHYRRVLVGIDPNRADDPQVWARIPTLTKGEALLRLDDLVAPAFGRGAIWTSTSGSSGQRMRMLLDRDVNAAAFALFWRAWESGGHFRLGQRHAAMKGPRHARGWSYNRTIRTLELSSVALGHGTARLFRALILRYRPRFIRGYPSSLTLFCRLLREQGETLSMPMVISGSETLLPFQRTEIEGFLGARLYNHYTQWERAGSILECEAGRLHAQEDYGHHEILDDEGHPCPPGVAGEITVTSLHNRAMPLLRYRTGDVAAWAAESCLCGQSFPVVDRIEGRKSDYLVTARGPLPATAVLAGMDRIPEVLFFQVIQWELDRVEVRVVSAPARDAAAVERTRRHFAERLGPGIELEMRLCGIEDLERSPVGKIRECYNRLPVAERPLLASAT